MIPSARRLWLALAAALSTASGVLVGIESDSLYPLAFVAGLWSAISMMIVTIPGAGKREDA